MRSDAVLELINRQRWLEPLANGLKQGVTGAFSAGGRAGQGAKNFLHGTWLGHPLHPLLTDIPVGAWTAALVLDGLEIVNRRKEFGRGADTAIGCGLLGAVGAALAGLTDWSDTDGRARKVGLVHGLLNITATLCYTLSWLARRRGDRQQGRQWSWLGYALAGSAAYLGGSLVYTEKIGVDHSPRASVPEDFMRVLPEAELPEGQLIRAEADGINVLLVRRGERICALAETCSHLGGPLAEGKLVDDSVQCPWHGSRFALEDGRVLDGPSAHPQPCWEARIRDGYVELRIKSG